MTTLGLTGGIASGKSTVAERFRHHGAYVVDADEVSRSLTVGPGPVMDELVAIGGADIRNEAGGLDRARLAKLLFADADVRRSVEQVLHPAIREEVRRRFEAELTRDPTRVLVVEAALLVETGRRLATDRLLVVEAPEAAKLARQIARDGCDEATARARLSAQAPAGVKVLAADLVVWNDGSVHCLIARADDAWHVLAGWAQERNSA